MTTTQKLQVPGFLLVALVAILLAFAMREEGPGTVQAQNAVFSETELAPIRSNIRSFFENLSDSNKGAKKALEELLKSSPLSGDEKTATDLAAKMKDIHVRFGNYLSFEEAGLKMIGTDVVVVRYLYKCQNYPVVWYFTWYRPPTKTTDVVSRNWTLIGMRYDSNLDIALRDSSF
ncbi:MAG: hypothetical protein Q4G68_04435 [Planctomycetia bacterium]|nr:hypothetical protein [Planctomycetia bacterium]